MLLMKMWCSELTIGHLCLEEKHQPLLYMQASKYQKEFGEKRFWAVCAGRSFQTACLQQQGLSLALLMQPLRRLSTRWSHWLPWELKMISVSQARGQFGFPDRIGQWTRSCLSGRLKTHIPLSCPTCVLIAPLVGRHPPSIALILRCQSPPMAVRERCCLELTDLCECN